MEPSLSLVEQLAHCTVHITVECHDGTSGTGTGFFYRLAERVDRHVPVIVTNKHVVENAKRGIFTCTKKSPAGGPDRLNHVRFVVEDFEQKWVPHPDGVTDLCVMPVGLLLHNETRTDTDFFYAGLSDSLIPTAEDYADFCGLEQVVMVGYPAGLWDETHNFPIFRRGIAATFPQFDWNGKPEFLIDAACFPGSSGSPVLICDTGTYLSRSGIHMGAGRIKLLGVLYGGPMYTVSGQVVVQTIPTAVSSIALSRIPTNLGCVIKAEKLRDFEPRFAQP